jgi:hypothetical protein
MQHEIGMSGSLIRFSFGLDFEIGRSFERLVECLAEVGLVNEASLLKAHHIADSMN